MFRLAGGETWVDGLALLDPDTGRMNYGAVIYVNRCGRRCSSRFGQVWPWECSCGPRITEMRRAVIFVSRWGVGGAEGGRSGGSAC